MKIFYFTALLIYPKRDLIGVADSHEAVILFVVVFQINWSKFAIFTKERIEDLDEGAVDLSNEVWVDRFF